MGCCSSGEWWRRRLQEEYKNSEGRLLEGIFITAIIVSWMYINVLSENFFQLSQLDYFSGMLLASKPQWSSQWTPGLIPERKFHSGKQEMPHYLRERFKFKLNIRFFLFNYYMKIISDIGWTFDRDGWLKWIRSISDTFLASMGI